MCQNLNSKEVKIKPNKRMDPVTKLLQIIEDVDVS